MWWCGFYGTYWRAWPRRTARRKTSSVLLVRRCRRPEFDVWIGLATRGAFSIIELSFEQNLERSDGISVSIPCFEGFNRLLEVCSRGSSILDWNRLDRCIWSSVFRLSFQKSDMFVGRLLVVWTIQTIQSTNGREKVSPGQQKVRWVRLGCSETFGNWNLHDHESFCACPVMFSDIYFQYRHILIIFQINPKSSSDLFDLFCFFGDFCSQGSVKRFNMSKSSAFTPRWKQTFPEVVCFQCQVEVDLRWTLFLTLLSCKHLIGHRPKYKCIMTYCDIYIYTILYIYIRCTYYLLISCFSDPGSFKPSSSVLTHSWCRSQGRSKKIYRKKAAEKAIEKHLQLLWLLCDVGKTDPPATGGDMRMPAPNGSRTSSFNLQLGDSYGAWGGSSWSLGHPCGERHSQGRAGYSYANFQRQWIALSRYAYNHSELSGYLMTFPC